MNPFKKSDKFINIRKNNEGSELEYGEEYTVFKIFEDDVYYKDGFALSYKHCKRVEQTLPEPEVYDHQAYIDKHKRKEATFKVGDWVRFDGGLIAQYTEMNKVYGCAFNNNHITKWEPKEGELVVCIRRATNSVVIVKWEKDKNIDYHIPYIGQDLSKYLEEETK